MFVLQGLFSHELRKAFQKGGWLTRSESSSGPLGEQSLGQVIVELPVRRLRLTGENPLRR